MIVKTQEERKILREAGKRLATVLSELSMMVAPGVSTAALDEKAEALIRAGDDDPAFLGYTPAGAVRPYPSTLCVSINDEIVHGIPTEDPQELSEGDIVGLDLGLRHQGLIVDAAITVPVGEVDTKTQTLIRTTKEALERAIAVSISGNHVGDIGHTVESFVKSKGFSVVRELGGHGVGKVVHEEPIILNFGEPGSGAELVSGMVIAIEPMVNEGTGDVKLADDGYTFKTADGRQSAHFEHTILITEEKPEILTQL